VLGIRTTRKGVSKAMSQLNVTSLKHESASGDNITLSSNGNVGIGTSLPNQTLVVKTADGGGIAYENAAGKQWRWSVGSAGEFAATESGVAERMRIDSAGRVTMPYQPCFSAWYGSAAAASTAGAILAFDTTHVNVGNHYSTSTNRFTAPVAGVYQFSWTALHRNAVYQVVSLYKNGTNIWNQGPLHVTDHSTSEATLGATVFINLASGDYVDVRVYNLSGGDVFYGQGHANFTGRLVG
jgi:hypothetical protein